MMEQSEELLKKRWIELSVMASERDIVTFSNFLAINELNMFHQIKQEIGTCFQLSGGYEFAERQMIAFIPDALYYEWEYPICCLEFKPIHPKFADELSHRDMLGALMNLGIERSRIGDIKISQNTCYVFCEENIAPYILDSLCQVRHTILTGKIAAINSLDIKQQFLDMEGIVSSCRLDNVVSFLTGQSRGKSVLLIQAQKVYVNGRIVSSNAYTCKENDVLSLRGYGKYIFVRELGETKKGRTKISIKKYV